MPWVAEGATEMISRAMPKSASPGCYEVLGVRFSADVSLPARESERWLSSVVDGATPVAGRLRGLAGSVCIWAWLCRGRCSP